MITKEKCFDFFMKLSQLFLDGNVWRSIWRLCMWILGVSAQDFVK